MLINFLFYNIQEKKIKVASSVGEHIDEHLIWKDYIKHIVSKANTSRAFLQREY